jgi:hypothetical protein
MVVMDEMPSRFTQGETVSFISSYSNYPAPTWNLTYYLRGPSSVNSQATPVGSDHQITLTSEDTSKMKAGDYRYQGYVSNGSEKYVVAQGSFQVMASLACQPEDTASQSELQQIVSALEASIKGLATRQQLEIVVGNVQIRYMNLSDKIKAHEYFSRLLANELARQDLADQVASGGAASVTFGRPVYARFRNPR